METNINNAVLLGTELAWVKPVHTLDHEPVQEVEIEDKKLAKEAALLSSGWNPLTKTIFYFMTFVLSVMVVSFLPALWIHWRNPSLEILAATQAPEIDSSSTSAFEPEKDFLIGSGTSALASKSFIYSRRCGTTAFIGTTIMVESRTSTIGDLRASTSPGANSQGTDRQNPSVRGFDGRDNMEDISPSEDRFSSVSQDIDPTVYLLLQILAHLSTFLIFAVGLCIYYGIFCLYYKYLGILWYEDDGSQALAPVQEEPMVQGECEKLGAMIHL